jgi:hypothetical protein
MAIGGVASLLTEDPDWLRLSKPGQDNSQSEIVMETVAGRQEKMTYVVHIDGESGPIRRSNVSADWLARAQMQS